MLFLFFFVVPQLLLLLAYDEYSEAFVGLDIGWINLYYLVFWLFGFRTGYGFNRFGLEFTGFTGFRPLRVLWF